MKPVSTLLLVAVAAVLLLAEQGPPPASDVTALLQPGPSIALDEFAYARRLPAGPRELVTVRLDEAVLAHSSFSRTGSFSDLRIVVANGRQVPYLVERMADPLRLRLTPTPDSTSASHGRSAYLVKLPHAGLPAGTLALQTSASVFRRGVTVEVPRRVERQGHERWFELVPSTAWRHDDGGTVAAPLPLDLPALDSDRLVLIVDEGDNTPLPITGVELQLPAYRVRFQRPADEPISMVYGRMGLAAPEYDLALVRRAVLDAPAAEIAAGAERSQVPASSRPVLSRTAFWIILVFACVALLWLIGTLVRMVGQDS